MRKDHKATNKAQPLGYRKTRRWKPRVRPELEDAMDIEARKAEGPAHAGSLVEVQMEKDGEKRGAGERTQARSTRRQPRRQERKTKTDRSNDRD